MKNIIKNLIFIFVLVGIFSVGATFAFAAPSVITIPPSATTTSITFNGGFSANGDQTTTRFEYSTNQNDLPDGLPGTGTIVCQTLQPLVPTTTSFSCTLDVPTITAGVTYFVRAVATNIGGTAYGSTTAITTTPVVQPTVLTSVPSATITSITFNGFFQANGNQTTTRFEYSTNQNDLPDGLPGTGTIVCQVLQTNPSGPFSCTLTVPTITADTVYYLRAVASNINGTAYGQVTSIQTLTNNTCPNPPTVSSLSPNNKNKGSPATIVTVTGSNFVSGTSQALFDGSNRTTNVTSPTSLTIALTTADLSSAGSFNISVTNGVGCSSGSLNFTVNNPGGGGGPHPSGGSTNFYPAIVTIGSSNITNNSATFNGTIDPRGYSTIVWFEYSTTSTFETHTDSTHVDIGSEDQKSNFVQNISDLAPNTIYYFRAAAENTHGPRKADAMSFKTLEEITGTITTVQATSQYSTSAKLNGIFVNKNNSSAQGYFEYGTTNSFGSKTSAINLGTKSSVSFSNAITKLIPNTIYYFRAIAKKDGVTYTGKTLVFRTALAKENPIIDPEPKIEEPTVIENDTQSSILQISTTEESIQAGGEVEYLITFNNDSSKNFENVKISVQLPDSIDFIASDFGKEAENNTVVFDFGTLTPSQSNSLKILGKLNAEAKDQDTIVTTAVMSYTPTDSTYQKDEIAYTINKVIRTVDENNKLGAATIFGSLAFLPSSFIGWLVLILVVLGFIITGRSLYNAYGSKNRIK